MNFVFKSLNTKETLKYCYLFSRLIDLKVFLKTELITKLV